MADLLDAIVRHQVYLSRYSTSVSNRLIALLNRSEPDLLAALQSAIERLPPESFTIERLEAVLTSVRSMRNSLYSQVQASAAGEIQRFAVHEAAFNLRMMQSAASSAGIQAVFSAVAPEQVYAAAMSRPFQGVVLREALQGVEAATARRVRDAIRMGFVEGKTIPQIVRDIKGTRANRYADGLLDWERRDIDAAVRTAITHTANVARQEFYAENDDIIDRWLFVATLDSRTTLTCASLSGKTFPIGKGPMPPRHYRCRSSSVPLLRGQTQLFGTRASAGGQIDANVSFTTWLRKQPVAVQDEILGVQRGKMFRAHKIEIDRFTDSRGRVYNLDELRRRDESLFDGERLAA